MKAVQDVVSKVGQVFTIGGGDKDAIAILREDHLRVEELFSAFERARSASNKQEIVDRLIREVTVHATIEESMVYPILENSRSVAERTAEAYEEHHLVKVALKELSAISAEKEIVKTKMKVLRELIRHHVKEEEGDLLPKLKRSGVDLHELATQMRRRKQQLMARMSKSGSMPASKPQSKSATTKKSATNSARAKQASKSMSTKKSAKKGAQSRKKSA